MELFIAIFLAATAWVAAYLSVGYKRWAALLKRSLPPNDTRAWWKRTAHKLVLSLGYEAFFRAFYLHLTFAGAATAAAIEGYKPASPLDAWTNPLFPLFLCLIVGAWSQFWLNEEYLETLSVSWPRIGWVVFFGILALGTFVYAVWLSIHWKAELLAGKTHG